MQSVVYANVIEKKIGKKKGDLTISILLALLILSVFLHINPISVKAQPGRYIDLFTQKEPFDGKRVNQSSDSFRPEELVTLYALVTYNEAPIVYERVAYQIEGPRNTYQNVTIVGSSNTNESGLSQFSFRIQPWPSENYEQIIFGIWNVIATVEIAEQTVVDTLSFRVGWIISITNITTLNARYEYQTSFLRQNTVVFNLTVENIALTPKQATIVINVLDQAAYPIMHVVLSDLIFEPGVSVAHGSSQIPLNATIGQANVSAAPYTALPEIGGVLYSPARTTIFIITLRDVAVTKIELSSNSVLAGEILRINVTVTNNGADAETFPLDVYYNLSLIETQQVSALQSSDQMTLSFLWNTSQVMEGLYQISATAVLAEDGNPLDNMLVDGYVQIRKSLSAHDVAVLSVVPSTRVIYAGDVLYVDVNVKNKGLETESFYVNLHCDGILAGRILVEDLESLMEKQIRFEWNTLGVTPKDYTLMVVAEKVNDEVELDDNTFVDGIVSVLARYPPQFALISLTTASIMLVLILVGSFNLFFLLYCLGRLRRRKKASPSYTIIEHAHI